jgi:hypothetical protein
MAVIRFALVASLPLPIARLPGHEDQPVELLRAAGALVSNILVFASWYAPGLTAARTSRTIVA